ncbi:MAG: LamG domain-containing protein [Proteobacteria bacterium]|nr:LamG domain-containing protein [Pseudomonadota bacterium]
MQYLALAGAIAIAACGRVDFDASRTVDASDPRGDATVTDADPLGAFRDRCGVLLHMDEATWSAGLTNACTPASGGVFAGASGPADDPIRGRVGRFVGTDCVTIADAPSVRATTALTTSAWVRMEGDPAGSFGIVSKRVDYTVATEYSNFVWTNSDVYADIDTEDDRVVGAHPIALDTWTQVTMVYDGALPQAQRSRIYVDGQLDVEAPESAATITQFHSPLAIGCLPLSGPAQTFLGYLDEVAIWTRALSGAEVASWYALTKR